MNSIEFYSKLCDYKKKSKNYDNVLAHSSNYKYYNKIKLPSGEVRYFYTKEEWDAYNNQVKEWNNEDSKDLEWQRKHVLNNGDGRSFNQKELKQYESYNKSLKNKDLSNLVVKEGFIKKNADHVDYTTSKLLNDIIDLKQAPASERNAIRQVYKDKFKEIERKYEDREESTRDVPNKYPFKDEFKDLDDIYSDKAKEPVTNIIKAYNTNKEDGAAFKETGKILKDMFEDIDSSIEEELEKREKSIDSFNNMQKAYGKVAIIEEDTKDLSKYEKQLLADELGISEWSDEALGKKYGVSDIDSKVIKNPGDDYGASNFDKLTEAYNAFWNDYKAAKKALNS